MIGVVQKRLIIFFKLMDICGYENREILSNTYCKFAAMI